MSENRTTNGSRSGRLLGFSATGFAVTVTLLMVLGPAGAGAVAHPQVTLTAPYAKTTNSPNSYWSVSGCAKAKAAPGHWSPTTGAVTEMAQGLGHTCGKSLGGVGGSGSGYAGSSISVAIPFKVAKTGNHSIGESWTVSVASSSSFAASPCPAKNVNYHPTLYQYSSAYCEAGASISVYFSSYVIDLSNSSWYSRNYSYADVYNYSEYQNYTDCYNYSTATCYNSSGTFMNQYAYGYNDPGFSLFSFNGATTFSLWANGTNMVKTDHFAVIFSISISADGYGYGYNLLGPFSGKGAASVNMGTLGNGATLNSVTIA
jgi:hypothetical protein